MKHGQTKVRMNTQYLATLAAAVLTFVAISAPGQASQLDRRIESSAKKTYIFKTYLQGDDIKIQSKDGATTLTGVVANTYHKALAQETVVGLPGVTSVENKLEIKGVPASTSSDAWLADKVKASLLFHRSVSATATAVDAKEGVVTLRGEAVSQAQKDLSAEYAKDVDGVKGVNNEMTVAKTPGKTRTVIAKIDDASITALVKMTLLYHRSTSALKTSVATKNGIVTLQGKASNSAELELATKLATDVTGVKSVKNVMTTE